jgi:hypothetical protein
MKKYIKLCAAYQLITMSREEELEDTKGVIRIRKSKKNRQHNDQKKKHKRTNNELQNKHIKLKIE